MLDHALISARIILTSRCFCGKINPWVATSPLCCDSDFQPYIFPIRCLKTQSKSHLFTPPRCDLHSAGMGSFVSIVHGLYSEGSRHGGS